MRIVKQGRFRLLLPIVAFWIWTAPAALPADLRVIANPSVKASAVTLDDLRAIFLETRTTLPDGSRVEPVLLKAGPVHEAFARQFLGKRDTILEAYYRSLVFTGKALMPTALSSEQEMLRYVARTKGAIGYVSTAAGVEGVKVLAVR